MSIMEKIFGARNQTSAPQQQVTNNPAQNPAPQATAQTPQTAPNGVVPEGGAAPSPLQKFEKVWEPTPTDPNAPPAELPIDPKKIMEAAAQVDFSKILSQEDLAKVSAGGQDAVLALTQLLNKTAQQVYGQSTYAASRLIEQAVGAAEEKFAARVPNLMQQRNAKELLLQKNSSLSNPAIAPIVEMMQSQLSQKYPNASSQEIADMAQEMMAGAAQVFSPQKPDASAKAGKGSDDWSSYV